MTCKNGKIAQIFYPHVGLPSVEGIDTKLEVFIVSTRPPGWS
jgi:hypothetical protein